MIQAICFDAFGTLVEITDKRRPFRALLRGGVKGSRPRRSSRSRSICGRLLQVSATSSGRAA